MPRPRKKSIRESNRISLYIPEGMAMIVDAIELLDQHDPDKAFNRTILDALWTGFLFRSKLLAVYGVVLDAAVCCRKSGGSKDRRMLEKSLADFEKACEKYGLKYDDQTIRFFADRKDVECSSLPPYSLFRKR